MTTATRRGPARAARGTISRFVNLDAYFAFGIGAVLVALVGLLSGGVSAAGTAGIFISEVHPSGSGNGSYAADWFEVTNTGTTAVDITGWKMDDSSNALASSVALNGVASIAPGQSVVFIDSSTPISLSAFETAWFGSSVPGTLAIGTYGGTGVGLSTGGDAVNLFDAGGNRITGISFGAATATATFDNTAGLGSPTLPLPTVAIPSVAGVNGAFVAANGAETGSPGKRVNASPLSTVDLSIYVRIGRFDLPEPTRTVPPANSLLAQEVSAVTYNWDTDTLFVVGDGGTSVVQVTKTGQLIDSMTLAPGGSPQGTDFYDPEGLAYVGAGRFVMSEERDRQAVLFTYAAGSTLTRSAAQTVKLGTFVPNIGMEGISYDPLTNGFIAVKEIDPQGIFLTGIDFATGTATNGSPTTENSINLFDPALANLLDLADVFPLSNLPALSGPQFNNLLLLSQEAGKIVNIDRSGNVSSSLTIVSDPGNPLTVAAQQHEGLTMDGNGVLYVVSENGGGDFDHPQLWVYAPSTVPNQAPTAVVLNNQVNTVPENTSTTPRIKVADVVVLDDGIGTNNLTVTGPDAGAFEVDGSGLFIKAGTVLDFEAKNSYSVTVNVDDPTLGSNPDATAQYALAVTNVNEDAAPPSLVISEIAPWSSGNSPVGADWFEVTNTSISAVNLSGWKMDDSSNSFAAGAALNGVTSIAPGESVIFIETADLAGAGAAFRSTWFGVNPPAGLQIGSYSAGGVGLSTGGDAVNLYDSGGVPKAGVTFGASPLGPSFPSFDNAAGLNNAAISQLSVVGIHGAFVAVNDANEIGSPGTTATAPVFAGTLIVSEVAPWSSGNSPVAADWFEVSNTGSIAVDITGWKVDDSSDSFASAVPLSGITSIAPGESVIFIESANLAGARAAFINTWFGASAPAGLQIGSYSGSGIGLGTGGDAVNLYSSTGVLRARVFFGASPAGPLFPTFDNAAGLNNSAISQPSVVGVHGAFVAANDTSEIGSPGTIVTNVSVVISEVSPWSSGNTPYAADWFEVTNTGASAVTLTGWKMDDNSNAFGSSVALNGITSIAPGQSVIFIESATPAAIVSAFEAAWFGATVPTGVAIGTYSGGGVGLGTGGDAVNLFDASGRRLTGVSFGASVTGFTFDNAAGQGSTTLPLPTLSTLSMAGVNGAHLASDGMEVGSPGVAFLNKPPVANAGPDQTTVEATGPGGAVVALNGSGSVDPDGDSLLYTWTEGGSPVATGAGPVVGLALGAHMLTLTVDDGRTTASDTVLITVRDTTPPAIGIVAPSQTQLWPPNNKMVPISVAVSAADLVTASPVCAIASVSSNEPGSGQWQVTGSLTLTLVASRNGNGDGRLYTIGVQCSDAVGQISSRTATVIVPHDKGK